MVHLNSSSSASSKETIETELQSSQIWIIELCVRFEDLQNLGACNRVNSKDLGNLAPSIRVNSKDLGSLAEYNPLSFSTLPRQSDSI